MEVKDNKNEQPLRHYRSMLAGMEPSSVSGRTGIPFDGGCFRTRLLNREVLVTWPEGEARWASGGELRPNAAILLLRLLTGGTLAPPTGRLLSYGELPWGETYLTQFRGRCISRLAFSFGNEPEKFAAACRSIGGTEAQTGSGVSFDIPLLPELTVRLTVWPGEDELPPSAQFLFSSNIALAFSAEDLAYCGDVILDAMKGRL
jgi:hypothetical protein